MTLGDLVPWGRKDQSLALRNRDTGGFSSELGPFMRLHQEMNRLFDDVFRGFDAPALMSAGWPRLEVHETDDAWQVTAELPGLDEKDVELAIHDGVLTIRGEKRAETRNKGSTVSERYYGRFERRIALGEVDEDKANAHFDNGVLTVTLPKSAQALDRVKRIPINGNVVH
jgi:HSP20 family protein